MRKNCFAAGQRFLEFGLALIERREALFRVAEFGLGGANAPGGIEKVLREFLAVALDLVDLALELCLLLVRALQIAEQGVEFALAFGPLNFLGVGGGWRLLRRGGGKKSGRPGERGEAAKAANHEAHTATGPGPG